MKRLSATPTFRSAIGPDGKPALQIAASPSRSARLSPVGKPALRDRRSFQGLPARTWAREIFTLHSLAVLILTSSLSRASALDAPVSLGPGTTNSPGPLLDRPSVTFQWQPVAGASGYRVYVRNLETEELKQFDVQAPAESCSLPLPSGYRYRWNLTAVAGDVESEVSEKRYFEVGSGLVRPVILSVMPSPVPASDADQVFVINGQDFRRGCSVVLVDQRTGERFPERQIIHQRHGQIVLTPRFTKAEALWTVEVVNPGGSSSGEFRFDVVCPSRIGRWQWWRGGWPWVCGLALLSFAALGCCWSMRRRLPEELVRVRDNARRLERERLLRDLHDRASADIAYLAQLTDRVARECSTLPPEMRKQVSDLHFAVRDAEAAIGDLVWAADPRSESLRQLAAALRERIRERLKAHGIETDFDGWAAPVPDVVVHAAVSRQTLYLCHEVLNNVLKHARATRFSSTLGVEDGCFTLGFRDNGCGFTANAHPLGHRGLSNLCSRVEKLRGELRIRSAPGEGTEISVRLPLKPERGTSL